MPLLFSSEQQRNAASPGFIVAERPTNYGPGVIILVTIFGLSFVTYALLFSFSAKVISDTELIHNEIAVLERSRDKKLETEILIFERRVNALSKILRSHLKMSQLFPAIEEVTLPNVFYGSMSAILDLESTAPVSNAPKVNVVKVDLQGSVPTLLDLARQMIAYREDARLVRGEISSFSLSPEKNEIKFSATLSFDKRVVLTQEQLEEAK